jgi:hypothetical protein
MYCINFSAVWSRILISLQNMYRKCSNFTQRTFSGLLSEGVGVASRGSGGHVGATICSKFPAEGAVTMAVAKYQQVAVILHVVTPLPILVRHLGVLETCFQSKKAS